jgi:hypothetical protein
MVRSLRTVTVGSLGNGLKRRHHSTGREGGQ